MPDLTIDRVLETSLYVDDLEAAERFYGGTLGLELVSRQEGRHVFFRIGRSMLLLFEPRACAAPSSKLPPHGASGAGHVALAVSQSALPAWIERLEEAGVAIEQAVDWPSGDRSIYFRDPAGNSLELASPAMWGINGDSGSLPSP